MMPENLKLTDVRTKVKTKNFRASDFLSKDEQAELRASKSKGKKRRFNEIDAYIAEIIARFGYDCYLHWKSGDISQEQMVKYVEAERSREALSRIELEGFILSSVAGANHPTKSGHAPKTLKTAFKVLKNKEKMIKGVL